MTSSECLAENPSHYTLFRFRPRVLNSARNSPTLGADWHRILSVWCKTPADPRALPLVNSQRRHTGSDSHIEISQTPVTSTADLGSCSRDKQWLKQHRSYCHPFPKSPSASLVCAVAAFLLAAAGDAGAVGEILGHDAPPRPLSSSNIRRAACASPPSGRPGLVAGFQP